MSRFIAIIQTGQPVPSALEKYGQFDQWFINAMELKSNQYKTFHVYQELAFPDIENLTGVIITGSPSMVTDELPWSEHTIAWLKQFKHTNIPVLGACYGHQMLAKMLGGTVGWNPRGRQMGQVNVEFNNAIKNDLLFKDLFDDSLSKINTVSYLATHQQSVLDLPADVTVMGSTVLDPYHCFRYGDLMWGLQFHPEFTVEIIKDYIHARKQDLINEGFSPQDMLAAINTKDHGKALLMRFKELCFSTQ